MCKISSFWVIFQDSRKLNSRSNRWIIFLHILIRYIYFSNSFLSINPNRDLLIILQLELNESGIGLANMLMCLKLERKTKNQTWSPVINYNTTYI